MHRTPRHLHRLALSLLALGIAHPATAQGMAPAVTTAQAAPAVHTEAPGQRPPSITVLRGQLGASINNAGAQLSIDLSRQRPLSRSRHPLWSGAHIGIGATTAVTPAHLRAGVWVEAAPTSIFVVRAGTEPAYYFGTFDSLASFDSKGDAFDTDSRRARHGASAGTATRLYLTPTLRLRAGRFVGLASADLEWWQSNAEGPFFYEPTRDTLLAVSGDRLTAITSAVLYELPLGAGHLTTGVTHSRLRVRGGSRNEVQRLGVLIVKQSDGDILSLAKPSLTFNASRYLDDPSKQGEWTASVAIGFSLHR